MKIAIIGGGITGLSTALALQKMNIPYCVYERASEINEVGAGIWMQPNAMKVLGWLDVGDRIRNVGMQINGVQLTNQELIPFRKTGDQYVVDELGNKITSIHRARLQQALFDALPDDVVKLGKEYRTHSIYHDRVKIEFQDEAVETDLLLGADGIHSKVRKQLFPSSKIRYSGQTCWRGIAPIELPEQLKAIGTEAWGNKIRFGFANISDSEVYWFAVAKAPEGERDDHRTLKKDLLRRYKYFNKQILDIITATPDEKIIRNDISDLKRLDTWHQNRVCLVGDAAHATTPNMGQGAGQGIEDAYYLGQILSKGGQYRDIFNRFEKNRREKVDYIVNTSWRIGKMAHSNIGQQFMKAILKMTPEKTMNRQMQKIFSVKDYC